MTDGVRGPSRVKQEENGEETQSAALFVFTRAVSQLWGGEPDWTCSSRLSAGWRWDGDF